MTEGGTWHLTALLCYCQDSGGWPWPGECQPGSRCLPLTETNNTALSSLDTARCFPRTCHLSQELCNITIMIHLYCTLLTQPTWCYTCRPPGLPPPRWCCTWPSSSWSPRPGTGPTSRPGPGSCQTSGSWETGRRCPRYPRYLGWKKAAIVRCFCGIRK